MFAYIASCCVVHVVPQNVELLQDEASCIHQSICPYSLINKDRPFEDELRFTKRGMFIAQGYCGALCEFRADLLEFVTACGFKTWANVENPCFCCNSKKTELYDFPANIQSSTWQPRDATQYNVMVQNSIYKVRVTSESALERLMLELRFDAAYGGLALVSDFAELGLPKGARLVQTGSITDLHAMGNLSVPAELTFFDSKGL
jgi:hypothetical protein